MGSGIVEIAARVGIDVTFVEPTHDLVTAGRARIEGSTAKAVERDKLTSDDREWPYSFINLCDILRLSPDAVREQLLDVTVPATRDAEAA
jgi:3-hydroxybutyryl-CoA dehydrogenase